jgi:NADH dehydrogenase [ubiquinone] 1 alpha subcomplex assembly factor 7
MSALADVIREIIATEGPIGIDRYMALALGHPRHGYYMTRDPFGLGGDFITAPEISQMFGELIGLWSAEVWMGMGQPPSVNLVELGPGRGTLMADALRALKVVDDYARAITVHLVETSPILRARQQGMLDASGFALRWHHSFSEVPAGPTIVIANEFFDALPVKHFVRTDAGWNERLVGIDEGGALSFGLSPVVETGIRAEAPKGTIIEIGAAGHRVMAEIAGHIVAHGGALLAIDYGHTETGFGETLQAMQNQLKVDPLDEPGEADLTAHVDFASLGRAASACGAQLCGPVTQGDFLTSLGIFERAAGLKKRADARQSLDIDRALLRLVSKGREMGIDGKMTPSMGALFKVICVMHPDLPQPPGFEAMAEA